jgi:hypothetical protein
MNLPLLSMILLVAGGVAAWYASSRTEFCGFRQLPETDRLGCGLWAVAAVCVALSGVFQQMVLAWAGAGLFFVAALGLSMVAGKEVRRSHSWVNDKTPGLYLAAAGLASLVAFVITPWAREVWLARLFASSFGRLDLAVAIIAILGGCGGGLFLESLTEWPRRRASVFSKKEEFVQPPAGEGMRSGSPNATTYIDVDPVEEGTATSASDLSAETDGHEPYGHHQGDLR